MTMGHCLNNTERAKRNHYEKSLSTTNLKHDCQGPKPSLHGAWPVTIRLSYGMALKTTTSEITFLPTGPNFQNSIFLRSPGFTLLVFWKEQHVDQDELGEWYCPCWHRL